MLHLKARIFGFFLILAFVYPLQAQENETNKPPLSKAPIKHDAAAASLNVGAIKLKENLGYHINPNTHIGIGSGFKFGFRVNF